jgi:hypothetical protein
VEQRRHTCLIITKISVVELVLRLRPAARLLHPALLRRMRERELELVHVLALSGEEAMISQSGTSGSLQYKCASLGEKALPCAMHEMLTRLYEVVITACTQPCVHKRYQSCRFRRAFVASAIDLQNPSDDTRLEDLRRISHRLRSTAPHACDAAAFTRMCSRAPGKLDDV